ncbi:MAG TPA: hypothetical protein VF810_05470 [Patescibacteria group bacterium]
MGHTQFLKDRVRNLRLQGLSLGQIRKETNLAKSTIRLWISDIILTKEQQKALRNRTQIALQAGRIRVQGIQKNKKIVLEKELLNIGKKEIGALTPRELFIAGIALYWAEGFKNKHEHRLGFCNSDSGMIKFYLRWLKESLEVEKEDLVLRLTLNESYKDKSEEIEKFWSDITEIPLSQFTKPFYQRTKWKKKYEDASYYGVLRIHIKDSLKYLLKMRGWIEGLKSNLPR